MEAGAMKQMQNINKMLLILCNCKRKLYHSSMLSNRGKNKLVL